MPHTHPVLIAEDDEDTIFIMERILKKLGLRNPIKIVSDGAEAIEYLENETREAAPRLVLLDVKMPIQDGFDVLQRVKANPRLCRLPVVMFSNSNQERDVNRAYDLGANSYVMKPTDALGMESAIGKIHEYWLTLNEKPSLE